MQRLLVLNLFISMLWPILNNDFTLGALLIGFILGFVLMSLVQRKYGYYTVRLAWFAAYVLYAILQSNLRLAGKVLANTFGVQTALRPGIVAVPLNLTNPFDITVLATIITLTPGTLSIDLGEDVSGQLRPYGEPEEDAIGLEADKEELREKAEVHYSPLPNQRNEPRKRGEAALLVHAIHVSDPKAFRAEIKRSFERPLLELRRLLVEMDVADR
jgi:multicomponent Na+:H+ antiporter subunit E